MTTVATPEVETISINDIKNNTPQSNKSTSVPNENPSTQMADIMKTSVDDKQTNELEKNQNQTQEIKTLESTEIANAPSQESCDFQSDTSLIRKQYIYKDNARIERTGRKIQFVDEIAETEPLTITKYSDTLHYAPILRDSRLNTAGLVEVKSSGGCCLIS
mmetsp:Transcript_13001/g.16849  ORF Transcript_13001/g.16849 Transcript_13001/m.16849 type:complete len:161 (+) Transcript_13001:224-706(+)